MQSRSEYLAKICTNWKVCSRYSRVGRLRDDVVRVLVGRIFVNTDLTELLEQSSVYRAWTQKAFEKGRQEGLQEGRQETSRSNALAVLTARFGVAAT